MLATNAAILWGIQKGNTSHLCCCLPPDQDSLHFSHRPSEPSLLPVPLVLLPHHGSTLWDVGNKGKWMAAVSWRRMNTAPGRRGALTSSPAPAVAHCARLGNESHFTFMGLSLQAPSIMLIILALIKAFIKRCFVTSA